MRIDKQEIIEKLKALAESRAPEDRRHWAVLYWKSQDLTHEQIADILDRSVQWVQRYSSRTYETFGIKDWEDEKKKMWLEKECLPVLKELIRGEPYLFKAPPKLPPEPSKGPVTPLKPGRSIASKEPEDTPEEGPPVMEPKNWTLPVGVELRTRNEVQDAKETQEFQCGVQNESGA
jgi:hypothetical protein